MKKSRRTTAIIGRVGREIRRLRRTLGLSQEELAFQADLDRTFVSRIEQGTINPSLAALVRISDALDVELKDLVS